MSWSAVEDGYSITEGEKHQLIVYGKPSSKVRIKFKNLGNGVMRPYNPNARKEQEFSWFGLLSNQAKIVKKIIEGAIKARMLFVFTRPKYHFRTGKFSGILKETAPKFCLNSQDCDNIEKFVLDCFNKKLYVDDSQIVDIGSIKRWGKVARVEMIFTELE